MVMLMLLDTSRFQSFVKFINCCENPSSLGMSIFNVSSVRGSLRIMNAKSSSETSVSRYSFCRLMPMFLRYWRPSKVLSGKLDIVYDRLFSVITIFSNFGMPLNKELWITEMRLLEDISSCVTLMQFEKVSLWSCVIPVICKSIPTTFSGILSGTWSFNRMPRQFSFVDPAFLLRGQLHGFGQTTTEIIHSRDWISISLTNANCQHSGRNCGLVESTRTWGRSRLRVRILAALDSTYPMFLLSLELLGPLQGSLGMYMAW